MNNALTMPTPAAPKAKSKSKDSDSDNRGELSCIRIEPAENGWSVCCSYDPEKIDPKYDRYSQMPEEEEMVFESEASAGAYVLSAMKGRSGSPEAQK